MKKRVSSNCTIDDVRTSEGRQDAVLRGEIMSETGHPLSARITLWDEEGRPLHATYPRWPGFWANGTFAMDLQPGKWRGTVRCGPEFEPAMFELGLESGQEVTVTVRLHRWMDLPKLGWYGGDSHIHVVHGENQIKGVDIDYAGRVCKGEGLSYANVCYLWDRRTEEFAQKVKQTGNTVRALKMMYPIWELEEACCKASDDTFILWWNLEAPKAYYRTEEYSVCIGHGWTMNMRSFGEERDFTVPPNYEICHTIHRQGGIVVYSHPARWWLNAPGSGRRFVSNLAVELPFDTVVGPVYDGIDCMSDEPDHPLNQAIWYALLNMGYKMPGTASSDACLDRPSGVIPGLMRTYTEAEFFSIRAIAEGIRRGRNFVTSGPFLFFKIGTFGLGDEIRADGVERSATIRAACTGDPGEYLTAVQLIRNGQVVRAWEAYTRRQIDIQFNITERETAWYIAKCYGAHPGQVAYTNPIYFVAEGYERPRPASAHLRAEVRDEESGRLLSGAVHIYHHGERMADYPIQGGLFEVDVPATSQLEIHVPGYLPVRKTIMMDYAPIWDRMINITDMALTRPETYQAFRDELSDMHWTLRLKKG